MIPAMSNFLTIFGIILFGFLIFKCRADEFSLNINPPKCCSRGQILNFTFDCVEAGKSELIVYKETSVDYPVCNRQRLAINRALEGNRINCIDKILLDNFSMISDSTKLIGLSCLPEVGATNLNTLYEVPKVVRINKCCPANRRYSNYSTGCWSRNVVDDKNTLVKLVKSVLNSSKVPDYIDISYGAPKCKFYEVLVDYKIPIYQVLLLDSEAFKFRIPGEKEYVILPPESVCVDINDVDDLTIMVRACKDETLVCKDRGFTCIRKCCPDGESMLYNNTCAPSKKPFSPQFYMDVQSQDVKLLNNSLVRPAMFYGRQCEIYLLEPWKFEEDVCYLDINGEQYSPSLSKFYDRDSYCLEYLSSTKYVIDHMVTFACFPEIYENMSNHTSSFFFVAGTGSLISSFFLGLTLIVYLCLPNLQNIHGKTIMCYIFSLLVAFLCLSLNQIGSLLFNNIMADEQKCRTLGYATVFSFLAAFSWLNVLSFDIWYTFGSLRSTYHRRASTKSRRFLYYNLYSWGCAATVTTITISTDHAAKFGYINHIWVSDIGITTCWFSKMTKGILIYFLLPAGIQMTINLILFFLTTRNYLRVKFAIAKMHNNSGARQRCHTDKKKFGITFKLFIIMGITWIMEMLSHIIDPPSKFWLVSDFLNLMHGVLIFIILTFKKKIFKNLMIRTKQILPCYAEEPKRKKAGSSTIFTTVSSECKLSPIRQIPNR